MERARDGTDQPATLRASTKVTGPEERRRAAVKAGHSGDIEGARRLARDPDASVRAAALGAMAKLGTLRPGDLAAASRDASSAVRRRASELAGRFPELGAAGSWLEDLLEDADPAVVEMAAWALGEQGDDAGATVVPALVMVAGNHPDQLCREAAVAAIGSIGDVRGFDAVIRALEDRPQIRRRAAVALAAFDSPRADDALRRCAGDRDWQVRAIAEELLEPPR